MFLLVAAASFAIGMAVDRFAFSPPRDSHQAGASGKSGGKKNGSARADPSGGSSPGLAGSPRSPGEPGKRPDAAGRRNDEGSQSNPVRRMLDRLDRGERIDFPDVARLVEKMPRGRDRRHAIERLASRWGREDPEAALAWAAELTGTDQRQTMHRILHEWSSKDPAAAANYAAQMPSSENSLHMVEHMAKLWAERNRDAAVKWGMAQSDPATRERALRGVVEFWGNSEPTAAADFASTIESPFERHRVLEVAGRRWAGHDIAGAMDWAQSLPAGDRQHATRGVLREVAERDPGRAAAIFDETSALLPEGSLQSGEYRQLAQEIASTWSRSSPQEAAAWAEGLPEVGEIQRGAVADVADHWLRLDSMAAGDWILQLPAGRTRDAAADRVVGSFMHTDPQLAFEWAASIGHEGHRTGKMRDVLNRWRVTDPGSARAALDAAGVSPERHRELSEVIGAVTPAPAPPPPDAPGNEE